jgi:hypothetical protein
MFQRQFKGQWGAVGWGGKPAMNIVFSVGSMYDSVVKIVVVITVGSYTDLAVKTIFTSGFWLTTPHTYKPVDERSFTAS